MLGGYERKTQSTVPCRYCKKNDMPSNASVILGLL